MGSSSAGGGLSAAPPSPHSSFSPVGPAKPAGGLALSSVGQPPAGRAIAEQTTADRSPGRVMKTEVSSHVSINITIFPLKGREGAGASCSPLISTQLDYWFILSLFLHIYRKILSQFMYLAEIMVRYLLR